MKAVLISASVALSSCTEAGPDYSMTAIQVDASCKILEHFIRTEFEKADRPVNLVRGPGESDFPGTDSEIERLIDNIYLFQEDPLPREELRAWAKGRKAAEQLDPISVCPKVKALWLEKSYTPTPSEIEFAQDNMVDYGFMSLTVTMPYTDLKWGEAHFFASRTWAPLAGVFVEVMYKRDAKGRWIPEDEFVKAIS
jgi:hypothetical protein